MDNTVNTIRSKVDIVDIIGERIPLTAKGKNFFGVCPFHDDTNPSMCVSREKQIYTCFSCHATGNVFSFLMNYEHMDFKETLKYLGDRVGVKVEGNFTKKTSKYDKLYEAYNLSVKYYQNNLNSLLGKEAKKYLQSRNINEDVIKEFGIGLSLDKKDDLTNLLVKKGYDLATLNSIGLTTNDYDIYRNRIMFSLYDVAGKVVGFSGRIYRDGDPSQSKYINSKETPIFRKGEMLYHYHIAKEEARLKKSIIVMEGFMDVIRASTVGIKNTVALMGTALTKEQIILLKRLSNNILLCLDGDPPGVKATLNIGALLQEENLDVKVISLPDPDDPDTFIMNNGKDKFLNLMDAALNFSDYKMLKLRETVDFRSDEEKANYINTVLKEMTNINDEIHIEVMLKRLAKEFDIGYNTLEMRFYSLKKEKNSEKIVPVEVKKDIKKKDKYQKAVEQVIYFMLNNDWVISEVEKEKLILAEEKSRKLCSEIIYFYKQNGFITIADFYTYVTDKEDILVLLNSILADNYNEHVDKEELKLYFKVIKDYSIKQEIKRLTTLMKKEIDPLEQAKLAEKIRKLRIGE